MARRSGSLPEDLGGDKASWNFETICVLDKSDQVGNRNEAKAMVTARQRSKGRCPSIFDLTSGRMIRKRSDQPLLSVQPTSDRALISGDIHRPWGAIGLFERSSGEFALRFRQRRGLDQHALSFVTLSALAEANHHGVPWTFRLGPARQRRIPGRQEFKIAETGTSQACRARAFHDKKITGAAAPVTLPGTIQRLNHDQLGRPARPFRQVLPLLLGEFAGDPVRVVQLFDRRVAALAEA